MSVKRGLSPSLPRATILNSAMNMPGILLTVLLFVSGLSISRANLGETEAQCIAKYGNEADVQTDVGYRQVGDKAASFNVKTASVPLSVRVIFLNGLSCHETFANADPSAGLSEKQMKAILDSQSAGLKWEKGRTLYRTTAGTTYGSVDWLRSDGATAKFWIFGKSDSQNQTGQVEVSTKQYTVAQRFYDKENGGN